MPSSLVLGCSRCLQLIHRRANPDEVTTDWRARRGKTAHRVRREGTAIAVPYPYPTTLSCLLHASEADVRRLLCAAIRAVAPRPAKFCIANARAGGIDIS